MTDTVKNNVDEVVDHVHTLVDHLGEQALASADAADRDTEAYAILMWLSYMHNALHWEREDIVEHEIARWYDKLAADFPHVAEVALEDWNATAKAGLHHQEPDLPEVD